MADPVQQAISDTMTQIQNAGAQDLDLAGYLQDKMNGAQVTKVNDDGTAEIAVPKGDGSSQLGTFYTTRFIKDHGLDPMQVKVQYNKPEQALPDNPIGFQDGVKMALSGPVEQVQS